MMMISLVEELGEALVGQPVDRIEPFLAQTLQYGYHRTTGGYMCSL